MSSFKLLVAAEVEYNQAADWYLAQSRKAADRFASEVERAIEAVCSHPERYARWDDTYRYYLLDKFPYFMAYRHTDEQITIVAIRHTSRDEGAWTDR
jgi:plasmid stabilization system protein ParE